MWHGIRGHDDVAERFRRSLAAGRLASTYLFVGPPGVGKRTFALALAECLLCSQHDEAELTSCGRCESCRLSAAGKHPDIHVVGLRPDKTALLLEQFIGTREKRMQEGLCHDISLKPFLGRRKVAVIDDADLLNRESANALLKTLEEPPPRALLILLGTSAALQLPTIRSRSQIVRFGPMADADLVEVLLAQGAVADRAAAAEFARYAGGSLEKALELADGVLLKIRGDLLAQLSQGAFDSVLLAKQVNGWANDAGTEAPAKRTRMRHVIGYACDFYRELLRRSLGVARDAASPPDKELAAAAEQGQKSMRRGPDQCLAALDRCLAARDHVDNFGNQATLVECWLDDLVRISVGKLPAVAM